jgi:methylglutaconyl-CoA hydratase
MSDAPVRYEGAGGVATITLDDPDRRNALSTALVDALFDGLQRAMADDQVRVVVLTNTGTTFCAGADLKSGGLPAQHSLEEVLTSILDGPKPVVGRIAGHCMGGGVGLAAACDVSVVVDDAKLGFTEVRLGLAPAIISVVCLPKLRAADARELFLTGERVSAERAVQVGLCNQAASADGLDGAVGAYVEQLLAGGPGALAAIKELIATVPTLDTATAFARMHELSQALFASAEGAEGMASFRERRPAAWVPQP